MRKAITIAALLALLAVPFWAVAANGQSICHGAGDDWVEIGPDGNSYEAHLNNMGEGGHKNDFFVDDQNPCPPSPPPAPCAEGDPRYQGTEVDEGPWSAWVLNADNLLERTRTVTTTIVEYSKQNNQECFRGIPKVVVETETKDPPIELFNNCNRWVVKQGNVELDKGKWTLPFELETAQSSFYEGVISEPKRCLQVPGPTATPEPEPTATPIPQGCWNTGDNLCPGDDDDPEEHPSTGGEIDAGLAVVTALSGLALTGIGGSILFMKRRASR